MKLPDRITQTYQNYNMLARVRLSDNPQKMIEFTKESIQIRDPTNKNTDCKKVKFSSVCTNQENTFSVIQPMIQKLIEGHNACVLSYGQTGSGKSYTLFGQEGEENITEQKGIIIRAMEYLLSQKQEKEKTVEFVISISMAEIFLEQIRDLGKAYQFRQSGDMNQIIQNYMNENLQIQENANGQIIIDGLTQINIRSAQELNDVIQMGLKLRKKLEQQRKPFGYKCHTIISVCLVQKDKEYDNMPFMNSLIQFIDLAGSERIAKSFNNEGQFEEAVLINQSLATLSKCLSAVFQMNSKKIATKDSKLTRILQNCLNSQVTLIIHLNPNENNFEECLSTLQYAEKIIGLTTAQITDDNSNQLGSFPGQDKLINKLQNEIQELKQKIELMTREHKQQILDIKKLLGIDLDQLTIEELKKLKQQKEALQKLEVVTIQLNEAEIMIDKLQKEKELLKKEESVKLERYQCRIIELNEDNRKLKGFQAEKKKQLEQIEQEKNDKVLETVQKQLKQHQEEIEKKVSVIINLPQVISAKTLEVQKHEDIKRLAKLELEKEYKQHMENLKFEYAKLLQDSTDQYEKYLQKKNEEIEHFINQFKKYQEKKKMQIRDIKSETFDLFDIVMKTFRVIEKIENGAYSSGIRSFNIPATDKPQIPTRNRFKNLFKYLDERSLNNTKQDGTKAKVTLQPMQMSQFLESNYIKLNLTEMHEPTLRQFANMIRDEFVQVLAREKELQKRVVELEILQSNNDLNTLIKERDEYKQLYLQEVKKVNQSKRIISGKSETHPNILIRPLTQQNSRYRL
ncbi:unnamed protein product [Paramecium sonneborni]|uniref:Kinesin motor domain-containing protein n=1 Tax=Paramecium sonneborni TaxID=65129 RepID=A0A8S1QLP8_9CILI|nr:unnamed protein product [Paramecium sonneborni]